MDFASLTYQNRAACSPSWVGCETTVFRGRSSGLFSFPGLYWVATTFWNQCPGEFQCAYFRVQNNITGVLFVRIVVIGLVHLDWVGWLEWAVLQLFCLSVASNPLPKVLGRSPGCISSGCCRVLRLDLPRLQVGIVRVGALWIVQCGRHFLVA